MGDNQVELAIRHVLVVDDDHAVREHIKAYFDLVGVQVSLASDGAEALRLIQNGASPDVILSDIKMANMDGFALLQSLRTNDDCQHIPFIFFSGYDSKMNLQRALDLGADGFLKKDLSHEQLLEGIRASFRRVQLRAIEQRKSNNHTPAQALIPYTPALPSTLPAATRPAASPDLPKVGVELRTYWQVLRYYRWHVGAVIAMAVIVVLGISMLVTPIYETTTTIRVASAAGGQFDYGATVMATRLGNTYVEIATSDPIMDELNARLDTEQAPEFDVSIVPETELLEITARHPDPAVASRAANTLAEILIERSLSLYAGDSPTAREILAEQVAQSRADLDQAIENYMQALSLSDSPDAVSEGELELLDQQVVIRQQIYADLLQRYETARAEEEMRSTAITIVERAAVPDQPVSPDLLLNTILALAGGLVGAVVLIVILESLDNRIRNSAETMELSGLPLVGQIPKVPSGLLHRHKPLVSLAGSSISLEHTFQALRSRLELLEQTTHSERSVYVVTSPDGAAGNSTIAANLALVLTQQLRRVVLVDANLYHPSLHQIFNLPQDHGLSDVLRGEAAPQLALKSTEYPNLRVLTTGAIDHSIFGLISAPSILRLLSELRDECDYLILDAPSILTGGYSTLLAKCADAVLVVAAERHTDRDGLKLTVRQLQEIEASIAGVVINKTAHSLPYQLVGEKVAGTAP